MLRCLPLLKACNQQVDYIDKRHCNLFAVPDDVLRYTSTLEELMLDANQIRELPRGLFRLQELRKLTLSDNEICRLPPDIANFLFLQELDVSRNDIEDIPENIKYCKNLQVADFSCNPLQRLPDGFTHLKNLTHLGLNDVSLTRLPNDIGSLVNLESLELRENLIKYLPTSLSFLVKLKTLDLGSNLIDELPDTIGSLPSLEELWLDCNEISDLPPAIGNLKNLTQLDVSENKLEQLPEEISGLTRLTDFILSQNHIEYLPEGIGNLKRLLILKVDQNQLVRLTPTIGNCECIQEMLLTENLLTELPQSIGRLGNLTILNVDRNQLIDVPREIGNCCRLGVLSMRDNRIGRLPNELGNLRDLHVLDVCGNRLQYLPLTLGSCSLKAVWLSENQIQPLLKFQTDTDESTGLKVLTCFLLPQQAYQLECLDNMMRETQAPVTVSAEQSDADMWNRNLTTSVKFAGDEDVDTFGFEESHFVRHNTPHPKELRARHSGKLVKKETNEFFDGSRDQRSPPVCVVGEYSGSGAALAPLCDREPGFSSNESQSSKSSDMSAGSRASTVKVQSQQPTPIDDATPLGGASMARYDNRQLYAAKNCGNFYQQPTTNHCGSGDVIRFVDNAQQKKVPTVFDACGGSPAERTIIEQDDVDGPYNDYSPMTHEDYDCPPGGRRVEFSPEVDIERRHRSPTELNEGNGNGSDSSSGRLQRRDTPHHLKNKRVNTATSATHQLPLDISDSGSDVRSPIDYPGCRTEPEVDAVVEAAVNPPEAIKLCPHETTLGAEFVIADDGGDTSGGNSKRILSGQSGKMYCESFESWSCELPDPLDTDGADALYIDNENDLPPPPSYEELTHVSPSSSAVVAQSATIAPGTLQKVIRVLREAGVPLGMSVAGGIGSIPHGKGTEGIFISRVAEDGPADMAGLRAADRLLSVNGTSVCGMDHQSVVSLLKEAGTSVCLVISRELVPVDNNQQTILVNLERDENGLGFTIAGGRGSTPYKGNDQSIYISRITEGGSADRDRRLRVGDKLISVNGIDITVAPHDQAVALLTGIRGEILLVVSRDGGDTSPSVSGPPTTTSAIQDTAENQIGSNPISASAQDSVKSPHLGTDWYPLIAYDDVIRENQSQQSRQLPEMTSPNDDNTPSSAQQHVTGVSWSPTMDHVAMPEEVLSEQHDIETTANSSANTGACAETTTPENCFLSDADHVTAVRRADESETDCHRLPADAADCSGALDSTELYSGSGTVSAVGGIDSADALAYDELLRTSKHMLFSLGDVRKPVTSHKMADAENKMHAALAAAGIVPNFELSPPGCADVSSTSANVHQMIQNELIQTLTLL